MKELEEGIDLQLDFKKLAKVAGTGHEMLPVVVQNAETRDVLILAYTNEKAFHHTLETGVATFWSSSRNELWVKGRTSGDTLIMKEVRVNCEQNSLLYLVIPERGGVCHTKDAEGKTRESCYYRSISGDALKFL